MNEEAIIKLISDNFSVILTATFALLGVISGSLLTGIFNHFQNRSRQKSEEKRHLSTLTVNAAIQHWERMHEGRKGEEIIPIDIYMVHMSKLAQEVLNDSITKENIAEKLRHIDEIVDAMKNYAKTTTKD